MFFTCSSLPHFISRIWNSTVLIKLKLNDPSHYISKRIIYIYMSSLAHIFHYVVWRQSCTLHERLSIFNAERSWWWWFCYIVHITFSEKIETCCLLKIPVCHSITSVSCISLPVCPESGLFQNFTFRFRMIYRVPQGRYQILEVL